VHKHGTGCYSRQPHGLHLALSKTNDEQRLLNLVRLRYRDRPLFLKMSALNTQFSFTAGAGAQAEAGDDDLYGIGGAIAAPCRKG
jgi:hypothetical protein